MYVSMHTPSHTSSQCCLADEVGLAGKEGKSTESSVHPRGHATCLHGHNLVVLEAAQGSWDDPKAVLCQHWY